MKAGGGWHIHVEVLGSFLPVSPRLHVERAYHSCSWLEESHATSGAEYGIGRERGGSWLYDSTCRACTTCPCAQDTPWLLLRTDAAYPWLVPRGPSVHYVPHILRSLPRA